jgi:hypothetical protein
VLNPERWEVSALVVAAASVGLAVWAHFFRPRLGAQD